MKDDFPTRAQEKRIESFVDWMFDNDIIPDDIKGVYDSRA